MRHVPIATELCNAERINISKDRYLHMLCFVVVVDVIRRTVTQTVLTGTLVLPAMSTFHPAWLHGHKLLNYCEYAQNVLLEVSETICYNFFLSPAKSSIFSSGNISRFSLSCII